MTNTNYNNVDNVDKVNKPTNKKMLAVVIILLIIILLGYRVYENINNKEQFRLVSNVYAKLPATITSS